MLKNVQNNKKNKCKQIRKEQRGITLIALVITIIIIIILATITINFAFGDNGLIKKAEEARDLMTNDMSHEQGVMQNAADYMNEFIAGMNGGSGTEEPDPPTPPEPEPLPTDGSFNEDKGVNTPQIGDNMELVEFKEDTKEWITDENNDSYNYVDTSESGKENKSEWANAKVTKNGIDSYFVWIPRYAYKITYYTDADKTQVSTSSTPTAYGTIDIKFINGTGNVAADGTQCKYANENPDVTKDYVVHPAFTTDANYGGGWSKELAGIWIGKYEAARSDSEGTTQGSATTIKTQPGVTSFRSITIGEMYTNALAYAEELQSHMLKNSEWGAVAYLTESKYGRNGTEVTQNTNEDYLTGGGTAYAETNTNQSSTGNVYGIYDLNGGTYEYVAGYYKNGDSTSLNNGSSFTDGTSDAYSTAYDTAVAETGYKYGDATYETSGWHSDSADFVYSPNPFFKRGGRGGTHAADSGIFYFYYSNGDDVSSYSFRLALVM